jgi:nucleoside-diphosphate-sugar epimerase
MTSDVVIGGRGFLGRHIVKALAERGDEVSVVDLVDFPAGSFPAKTTILDLSRANAGRRCDRKLGQWRSGARLHHARPFDVPVGVLDVVKAFRELGWGPRISLRSGIGQMIGDLVLDATRRFSSG